MARADAPRLCRKRSLNNTTHTSRKDETAGTSGVRVFRKRSPKKSKASDMSTLNRRSVRVRRPVVYSEYYNDNELSQVEAMSEDVFQEKSLSIAGRSTRSSGNHSSMGSLYINVKVAGSHTGGSSGSGSETSDSGLSSGNCDEPFIADESVKSISNTRAFCRALSVDTIHPPAQKHAVKKLNRRHTESLSVPITVISSGTRRSARLSITSEQANSLVKVKQEPGLSRSNSCTSSQQSISPIEINHVQSLGSVDRVELTANHIRAKRPTTLHDDQEQLDFTPHSSDTSPTESVATGVKLTRETSLGDSSDSGAASDDQSLPNKISACQWKSCRTHVKPSDLIEHMDKVHVSSQTKVYKCYWSGCRVYGKVAKSQKWLDGHVRKHLGSRPYFCIFPDCKLRFGTRALLQKHVDNHITTEIRGIQKQPQTPSKSKKNKKRLRGTELCLPPTVDFVGPNIIQSFWWHTTRVQNRWGELLNKRKDEMLFHSEVVSSVMSMLPNGTTCELLQLHWYPEEFSLPNTWCKKSEREQSLTRSIKISMLPTNILIGDL